MSGAGLGWRASQTKIVWEDLVLEPATIGTNPAPETAASVSSGTVAVQMVSSGKFPLSTAARSSSSRRPGVVASQSTMLIPRAEARASNPSPSFRCAARICPAPRQPVASEAIIVTGPALRLNV
jgi:hypothetical protein